MRVFFLARVLHTFSSTRGTHKFPPKQSSELGAFLRVLKWQMASQFMAYKSNEKRIYNRKRRLDEQGLKSQLLYFILIILADLLDLLIGSFVSITAETQVGR